MIHSMLESCQVSLSVVFTSKRVVKNYMLIVLFLQCFAAVLLSLVSSQPMIFVRENYQCKKRKSIRKSIRTYGEKKHEKIGGFGVKPNCKNDHKSNTQVNF